MRKIGLLLLAVALLTLLTVTPGIHGNAQEATPLEVGKIVLGEVTKAVPDVKFTFGGKKGEYYAVSSDSIGKSSVTAQLTIIDSGGATLGKSTTGTNALIVQLPADGDYTVNVRHRLGDGGKIAVQLYRLSKLEKGAATDVELTYRLVEDGGRLVSTNAYYLIESANDFKLTVTVGEEKFRENASATVEYSLSQPRNGDTSRLEMLFTSSGDKFVGLTVTFKGSTVPHILALRFTGYAIFGKLTLEDLLSRKFSVKVEEN